MGARKSKPKACEQKVNKDVGKHKACVVCLSIGHKDFKTGCNFYLGYTSHTKKTYERLEDNKEETTEEPKRKLQAIKEEEEKGIEENE